MSQILKVLILEDNLNDAKLLQRELKKSGLDFVSEVVETRDAFLDALANFKPSLILSDYSLPGFDGVTAFHLMQKVRDIPFIIVSGIIGEENAVELIKMGITDYVLKDKLFTLTHKINRALNEHKERQMKLIIDATLKLQNEKLLEIAFLQSHQVRVPIAQILGLFELFKFDVPESPVNRDILLKLKVAALSLDQLIQEIVLKTNEVKGSSKSEML